MVRFSLFESNLLTYYYHRRHFCIIIIIITLNYLYYAKILALRRESEMKIRSFARKKQKYVNKIEETRVSSTGTVPCTR